MDESTGSRDTPLAQEEAAASEWSLYIIRCGDGSLYTGISVDVTRRLAEHRGEAGSGRGAKALRGKGPLVLVWQQSVDSRSAALRLEYRIKQLSRVRKEALIRGELTLAELHQGD